MTAAITTPTDTWQIGGQTVILGDCLQVIPRMEAGSIDVVVSSPPYNIGTRYGAFQDDQPREEYVRQMRRLFCQLDRVLTTSGSLFLNMGWKASDPWVSVDVALTARAWFQLQNRICWVKSIALNENPCIGHGKPINSNRYLNQNWEEIWHFTKSGNVRLDRLALGVPFADEGNLTRGTRGKNGNLRCRGNVWFIPYPTLQSKTEKGNHPAIFPVQLAEWCLRLHGVCPALRVLDPFAGVMTTLQACARLGVRGVGIEIDTDYVNYGRRILQEICNNDDA